MLSTQFEGPVSTFNALGHPLVSGKEIFDLVLGYPQPDNDARGLQLRVSGDDCHQEGRGDCHQLPPLPLSGKSVFELQRVTQRGSVKRIV